MTPFIAPQARCRAAAARRDITPPVGIYHRMWGAATHDRATGVHRPLLATAVALESSAGATPLRRVLVGIDHCLMWHNDLQRLRAEVCARTGMQPHELLIDFSHTHAAGLMDRSRAHLPGGELIAPYLDRLALSIAEAAGEACAQLQEASIVYGSGRCDLAVNRDQLVDGSNYVCGLDPALPTDDSLLVARIVADSGQPIATIVNYACHPTTLAWQNTLISPDYVGAMREVIEGAVGGLCLFLLGACGDLGPSEGYVGETQVADRHGRQLGYAALSVVESMRPAGQRYRYVGPVVSGATLGDWRYEPLAASERASKSVWHCRDWNVAIPYRAELPTLAATQAELESWQAAEAAAQTRGDDAQARDCRAQAERMCRQLTRLGQLPEGSEFSLPIRLWKLGDGYWVFLEGEYYHHLQRALRSTFADRAIIVATVVDGWRPAYLPTRATYGRGIYQEQVAILAPGCLETATDAIAAQVASWEASHSTSASIHA